MQFSYKFPAVQGVQAGEKYYISMVPLKLLNKLFPLDEDIVMPEYRAQRKINEARIPEIKKYILDNRDNYVFSALSASIDGDFTFFSSGNDNVGVLEVDMNSIFLINDGQHRRAAIVEALNEDKSLENETISIVFFKDSGLKRSQQMFTDLNKHAVKTSNSLSTLYDSRDEVAVATKQVIDSIPFFKKYTDKERDILGKNSFSLFTLTTMYKANLSILKSNLCTNNDLVFLKKYWSSIAKNIVEWNEVFNGQLTKKDLRENYIVTLAIVISAFGSLGRYFYENKHLNIDETLRNMNNIDWSRDNDEWIGRTIRDDGKIAKSDLAVSLTCNLIKQKLCIPLSKEEKRKENQFQERS